MMSPEDSWVAKWQRISKFNINSFQLYFYRCLIFQTASVKESMQSQSQADSLRVL